MISPGLLTSDDLAGAHLRVRFAFVGLLMYLDDSGRGRDSALLIRAHVWPLDPQITERQVESDLAEMARRTLICRYEEAGKRWLHSPSWSHHQKISHATKSDIPPCPIHELPNRSGTAPEPDLSDSSPREVKSIQVEDRLSEVKGSRDLTARSASITAAYLKLNPMAEKYPTQRIVAKAIGEAGYTDAQVSAALAQLARDGRPLTANTLYVEINGQPKTSTTNSRVSQALALAEQFRSVELPEQRAIGDGS